MLRPTTPFLLALALAVAGCTTPSKKAAAPATGGPPDGLFAEITTPRGVMTCELFFQKAPLTVASFVGLAEGTLAPRNGKPFYTGLTWYRVVPGFVIQSGNPGLKDTDNEEKPIPHHFPDEFEIGRAHV